MNHPLPNFEVGLEAPSSSDISVKIFGYCDKSIDSIKLLIQENKFSSLTGMGGEYTLVCHFNNITSIITSPIGAIQYFYFFDGKRFSHGKCISDIVKDLNLSWIWDWESVGDLCEQENLTENRTMHNSIKRVPPGTILQFDGNLTVRTKNFLDGLKQQESSPIDALNIFNEEVVKWIGSSPVLSLSGGFDSRAILSSMLKQEIYPRVVTLGDDNCSDIEVASQITREFALDHTIVNLSINDFLEHSEDIANITNGSKPACHWHTYLYPKKASVSQKNSFFVGTLGEFARCYYFDKGILSLMNEAFPKYAQLRFWQLKLARHRTFRRDENKYLSDELRKQVDEKGIMRRSIRNAYLSSGEFLSGGSKYYLEQRVPNFYANGISMYNATSQWRSPFHNTQWLKNIWSMSDHWKLGSNWHRLVIKRNYPKLLEFPEEKGFSRTSMLSKAPPMYWLPIMQRCKYKSYDMSSSWFSDSKISSLILDNHAMISEIIDRRLCESILQEHKQNHSRTRAISFILTVLLFKLSLSKRGHINVS